MNSITASIPPIEGDNVSVTFDSWVGSRTIAALGTNSGADILPFQTWRRFKEAFTPELVKRAIHESERPVARCLDPFAGSGTTALSCQFLGVLPTTIEVNPYLADLTEAKLATYNVPSLIRDYAKLIRQADSIKIAPSKLFVATPPTMVEPGKNGRWIFDRSVARRLASYRVALDKLSDTKNARLLRVLLGGVLVSVSNVVISGKGRRYRSNWSERRHLAIDLDEAFCKSVENAIKDIVRHAERSELDYTLLKGDARELIKTVKPVDLAVFSPPYPNSFDYTDVYNIELWALGYLTGQQANRDLRTSTLSSHVQVKRNYSIAPKGSKSLDNVMTKLRNARGELWNPSIPEMIGAYFSDMNQILRQTAKRLKSNGQVWMVVGDSQYAGISIPVAKILCELSTSFPCRVVKHEPFRSMRASPQQGGAQDLAETLVVLSVS